MFDAFYFRDTWLSKTRFVRWLWGRVYRRWLDEGETVVRVVNWRCALIQSKYGSRRTMTPIFWGLE